MIWKRHNLFRFHAVQGRFTVKLHYDGENGAGNHPFISIFGLLAPQNLQALQTHQVEVLRACRPSIGPRARLILTPVYTVKAAGHDTRMRICLAD